MHLGSEVRLFESTERVCVGDKEDNEGVLQVALGFLLELQKQRKGLGWIGIWGRFGQRLHWNASGSVLEQCWLQTQGQNH